MAATDSKKLSAADGKTRAFIALHAMLVLYSLSGICAKLAGRFDFLSLGFVGCYAGMIAVLGVYAIGWQQVIKRLPLTLAYANRAVTVVWGLVWGVVLFGEQLNAPKVAGCLIVLAGVALYAYADAQEQEADAAAAPGTVADDAAAPAAPGVPAGPGAPEAGDGR